MSKKYLVRVKITVHALVASDEPSLTNESMSAAEAIAASIFRAAPGCESVAEFGVVSPRTKLSPRLLLNGRRLSDYGGAHIDGKHRCLYVLAPDDAAPAEVAP